MLFGISLDVPQVPRELRLGLAEERGGLRGHARLQPIAPPLAHVAAAEHGAPGPAAPEARTASSAANAAESAKPAESSAAVGHVVPLGLLLEPRLHLLVGVLQDLEQRKFYLLFYCTQQLHFTLTSGLAMGKSSAWS